MLWHGLTLAVNARKPSNVKELIHFCVDKNVQDVLTVTAIVATMGDTHICLVWGAITSS